MVGKNTISCMIAMLGIVMNTKKKTLLTKVIQALTNDELFVILYSDKYSMVTIKQVSKVLNSRGVYG